MFLAVFAERMARMASNVCRTPIINQVPCSSDSLNTGDVFILDAGLKLYLWSGENANMYEKSKGVQTMQRIKVKKCHTYEASTAFAAVRCG